MNEEFKCAACTPEYCECEDMGWISVKDKLPPEDEIVLGWDGKEIWICATGSDVEEGIFYWCEINHTCGCCQNEPKPTHWMPLPKPPESHA